MSLMVQILTSTNASEVAQCFATLKASAAGTGFMHESFNKDDATQFTRSWFAWANSLFADTVLFATQKYPGLMLKGN